ncbi:hypothetical protein ACHAWF_001180, partial [Thalassiosira exigua]
EDDLPPSTLEPRNQASLAAYSEYDPPSAEALVWYFHAVAGFPVRDTWQLAIKNGNYESWLVRVEWNDLVIRAEHISRLYTGDTGRFPVRNRKGNQYVMIACLCERNVILACPFKSRKRAPPRRIRDDYGSDQDQGARCRPPNPRQRGKPEVSRLDHQKMETQVPVGTSEHAPSKCNRTSYLHVQSSFFGHSLWRCPRLSSVHAEITLNFLRSAEANKRMSAWEYFHGPFNYDATPLGPLGSRMIAHNKPSIRKSWDFCGEDSWGIGAAMLHCRSQQYVLRATHEVRVNDTVEFRHPSIHQPHPTPADRLQHGMPKLADALGNAPPVDAYGQLEALEKLRLAL